MLCIQRRTEASTIPPLDSLFSTFAKNGNGRITKDVVEKVYFAGFPSRDASMSLSALSMNSRNIVGMRESGSLGVVVEMLRRVDFDNITDNTHVADLVRSVSILTEDQETQERLMSNSYGIDAILKLCVNTTGKIQEKIFSVMDNMCRTERGMDIFLQHGIFQVLLSPEMLYRSSTPCTVRAGTASLISRIASRRPKEFPPENLEKVLLVNGVRTVDGSVEMQLLNAFLSHLTWLSNEKKSLKNCSAIFIHLINEIKSESFEDLEHLLQCLKCIMIVSRDLHFGKVFMKNNLGVALQYVVRTDFELWQNVLTNSRPSTAGSRPSTRSKLKRSSTGTQNTVEIICRNTRKKTRKSDDINYKTTRLVVLIYENVMKIGLDVVGEIVSSGLISSLLFRVGTGNNIDRRFLRLVVHFLYLLLVLVAMEYPFHARPMSMVRHERPREYTRGGMSKQKSLADDIPTFSNSSNSLNEVRERIDIRSVSNKLHVQGVTQLLLYCLEGDDYECVSDAMTSLAAMSFQVIKQDVMKEHVLQRLSHYCLLRNDCFFEGLQLLSHSIILPQSEYFPGFIEFMVKELNIFPILIKAMKLSGWVFHSKSYVYEALSLLTGYPGFCDRVRKCRGINIVVYEVDARKKQRLFQRKNHMHVEEDSATDRLFSVLKEDWAATRIQAMMRAYCARKKADPKSNDYDDISIPDISFS